MSGQQCLSTKLSFIFLINDLKTSARVLCRETHLTYVKIKFRSLILKIFRNVEGVLNGCQLQFLLFFFFLFYRILFIEILHLSQRVESIHETQAKTQLQDIHNKNKRFSPISYLIVCVRALKDARFKIKMQETYSCHKNILQSHWYRYHCKKKGGPNTQSKRISCYYNPNMFKSNKAKFSPV